MEILQFKTNIKCAGCVAKVTPVLNEAAGENNWKLDITNPGKILTVSANSLTEDQIKTALGIAGYKAERLTSFKISA